MKTICFGEIMCRLSPEGRRRFVQADRFEICYGGSESNVAVSLANFGTDAAFVSRLPKHKLADAALRSLREHGVDVSDVRRTDEGRLGLYFLEKGASQRPSKVIYDRAGSSLSLSRPGEFNWPQILAGADYFHFSGITPALSDGCAALCFEACRAAKDAGVKVSCDINYRSNLWTSERAGSVMSTLLPYVDLAIINDEHAKLLFGIRSPSAADTWARQTDEVYTDVARMTSEMFGIPAIALTIRGSISAEVNDWSAMLYIDKTPYFSKQYRINLVDRIGGGDAFSAGLVYALGSGYAPQAAVDFAAAAAVLAQSTEFDAAESSPDEIDSLARGASDGRVQR